MLNFFIIPLKFSLSIIFVLTTIYVSAQTKSTITKTIDGKKYYIHKVEKGQSLYAISRIYGLDINAIVVENHDAIDGIQIGQELKVPFDVTTTKPIISTSSSFDTTKYICHKVQKGETIYSLTKKYVMDEKTLLSYNPTLNQGMKEGDLLVVGNKNNASKPKTDPIIYSNNNSTSTTNQITSTKSATVSLSTIQSVFSNGDSLLLSKGQKSAYRIGLFLPFKLNNNELINIDELVQKKSSFPSAEAVSIDFYTGFKMAFDSLSTQNFDLTLNLFDIDHKDSLKLEAISKTSDFKRLDAIFGPLNATEFKQLSSKAKLMGIPTISPLTQPNKILYNNSLSSKVTPSQHTLIEGLANFCLDSLPTANVILVNTTAKDFTYVKTFRKQFNDNLLNHGKALKDSARLVKGIAGVKDAFMSGRKNIVVVFTNNQVYLQDFITQLSNFSDKKDIDLIGFDEVSSIENLDQEYLNKLHFHFASTHHIDYLDPQTHYLGKQYQDIFNTEPSDYFFTGYDIGMYYLSNLKKQGPAFFLSLDKNSTKGLATDFMFYRPDATTGFENRAMSIYKYQDYKLVKTGW